MRPFRTLAALLLALGGFALAAPAASADVTAAVTKLSQSDAASRLGAAGITWSSSGNCSNRNNSTCTSFDQINLATVQGVITFKNVSGCAIRITGGTETGHASGTYSHWNGYKVDVALTTCVTNYVKGHYSSIGGNKWEAASGNVYYLESNHWDITYYSCGC
ncbi:hypothetical protein [Actinosynnema sp. NPDC020468]|uniref:hypothetical protein n=1 Tax=Actinosynnema sp. NPDC020468 TaxID=3154488 RepID=UPI0033F3B029